MTNLLYQPCNLERIIYVVDRPLEKIASLFNTTCMAIIKENDLKYMPKFGDLIIITPNQNNKILSLDEYKTCNLTELEKKNEIVYPFMRILI